MGCIHASLLAYLLLGAVNGKDLFKRRDSLKKLPNLCCRDVSLLLRNFEKFSYLIYSRRPTGIENNRINPIQNFIHGRIYVSYQLNP
jgi:hypothetical protein